MFLELLNLEVLVKLRVCDARFNYIKFVNMGQTHLQNTGTARSPLVNWKLMKR
jgi:hypothetical protein